jgi:hypothetical protein
MRRHVAPVLVSLCAELCPSEGIDPIRIRAHAQTLSQADFR